MTRRLPVIFIFLTVVIDGMGIGVIMPVMPDLIRDVTGGNLANAAKWGGMLAASFAVMQFLFGPMLGNLSDRFGRRPVLLISLFVMSGGYLVMALAGSIWLLMAGRLVGGITSATQSTASAYMADISKPEEKAANFGLIGAGIGLGFVIGPLIGGLLGALGPRAPFYAAAALAMGNFILGALILPETVTDATRRTFSWGRANPFGAFRAIAHLPGLKRLLLLSFTYGVTFAVYPAVWSYFTQARFGWDSTMTGVSLATFGFSMALTQGVILRPVVRRLGERRTVLLGLSFSAIGFLGIITIPIGWLVLALTPVMAFGGVTGPSVQGLMSRAAADDQQGELQGLLTSISALTLIISPMMMTQTFAFFTSPAAPTYLPTAPFILSLGLTFISLMIFLGGRRTA